MAAMAADGHTTDNPSVTARRWLRLPTLSMTGWLQGNAAQRQAFAEALCTGAERYGFMYLADHGIPKDTINGAYAASAAFHNQPDAFKRRYGIEHSRHHRGYASAAQNVQTVAGTTTFNYHETFDLSFDMAEDDPRNHPGFGLVGPNVWPDMANFRAPVMRYYQAVYTLGQALMAAFEMGLGFAPGTLLQHVNIPTSQLRLMKYFENDHPADAQNTGISAHSDFECFTLLNTAGPGLQVLSVDDHWIEAPSKPGTFVLNTGDCMEAWTGGRLKSTQHRVLNTGRERYSLPFFFATDYDVRIRPLPPYDTPQARAAYPEYCAGEHLWGRTIQTFPYLRERWRSGELVVPFAIAEENPFKRISVEERAKAGRTR